MNNKLSSSLILFVLLVPSVLAGAICEGIECVPLVTILLLFNYGWILGIILVVIASVLIYLTKKKKLPVNKIHIIMLILGGLLMYFPMHIIVTEKMNVIIGHRMEMEAAKNLSFGIYMPSYLPQEYQLSRITIWEGIIYMTISKIDYDRSAPGTENLLGEIREQKSKNANTSLCWFGMSGGIYPEYEPCKVIGILNDSTELFVTDNSESVLYKLYVKKSGTDIYLKTNIGIRPGEEIPKELVDMIESFSLITKDELSRMLR
ncbi:MAG: hypothetical protein ABIF10_02945 [Candidatus Woesearchaeota archaeon]